jgi:transcriptional regulator with XRE-family HTH domain
VTGNAQQKALHLVDQLRDAAPPGGGRGRRGTVIECGKPLQELIALLGMNVKQFGREADIAEMTLRAWLSNKTYPRPSSLSKIRRYLEGGVPMTRTKGRSTGVQAPQPTLQSPYDAALRLLNKPPSPYAPRPEAKSGCVPMKRGRGKRLRGLWAEILRQMLVHQDGGPKPDVKELVTQFVDEFGGGVDGLAEYIGVTPQRIRDFMSGASLPTPYEGRTWHNLCLSDRIYFGYEPLIRYGDSLVDRIEMFLVGSELHFLIGEK